MTAKLPNWANELRTRYLSGETSLFMVHGNVRDLHPWVDEEGNTSYVDIRGFLQAFFARTRDITAYYNVSQGIEFPDRLTEKRFQGLIDSSRMMRGAEKLAFLPRDPSDAIPLIEELITNGAQASGVIVDFFEMIAPQGDVSFMSTDDRANLVSLQRWASDPAFLNTDNIAVLIAEHLSDVSRRVVASAQLVTIQIPYPDLAMRRRFLDDSDVANVPMEMDVEALAKVTAGLSLLQIRSLLRTAKQGEEVVTFRTVAKRKKSIIEQECHGLVEFVAPDHDFSHVGGMARIKTDLMRVAAAVKAGHKHRVPMGMIFVGPMGTGKTFLAEAFAAESGLTCLKFKNFREKWVGSTEGNLEKILELVEALGYVLLIIDEADRSLSSGDNDGGTSSRVIARLKEFMSDTSHRGRVVMLMMTNRPDKLDVDLKRPGRFDMKVPFFFPETAEERQLMLEAQVRRHKLPLVDDVDWTVCLEATDGYSAAELEAVMLAASARAGEDDRNIISQSDIDSAALDIIPSRDKRMLEYMEMLAVFECSAKRMLPERYRELDTDQVQHSLDQLRAVLGRRAQ